MGTRRNRNELLPLKQRVCRTLYRTQFDSLETFTSKHDMILGEIRLRSAERSIHVETVDFDDTVVRLHRQGLLVLLGQHPGGCT